MLHSMVCFSLSSFLFSHPRFLLVSLQVMIKVFSIHFSGLLKPWELKYDRENEQLYTNLNCQTDVQKDYASFRGGK